jgi:hypothetical protein
VAVAYDLQPQLESLSGGENSRWLIYMNKLGQRKIMPVKKEAWLVTWDEVVDLIRTNGFLVSDAAGGICHICGGRITVGDRWDADRIIALENGGTGRIRRSAGVA